MKKQVTLSQAEVEKLILNHLGVPKAEIKFNLKRGWTVLDGFHKVFDSVEVNYNE